MSDIIPTAKVVQLIDVDVQPPPQATKLLCLSKYGVLSLGIFQHGFHVAWAPLPKTPESVKVKLREEIHG